MMIVKLVMFIVSVATVILVVKKVLIPAFSQAEPAKLNKKDADQIQKFDDAKENLNQSITQMEEAVGDIGVAEEKALQFAETASSTIKQGKKIIKQVNKINEEKGEKE